MALRAGVAVADVEFMQFHPTALHHPAMPRPLLSEALRGHGALLRDAEGERFVDELAPRDVVAKAMAARMLEQGVEHMWLDATGLEQFAERFPTIAGSLTLVGLDPSTDWLPIAPAAHYLSGGVVTDLDGCTALSNLWACGETACTGVHGANRLASNSLLEGMVFAPRVVEAITRGKTTADPTGAMRDVSVRIHAAQSGADPDRSGTGDPVKLRDELQRAMTLGAGVLRDANSLGATRTELDRIRAAAPPDAIELQNLIAVAEALLRNASAREESRGAHTRLDFPETRDEFQRRLVIT
jgi:L-aspartate oxidase